MDIENEQRREKNVLYESQACEFYQSVLGSVRNIVNP